MTVSEPVSAVALSEPLCWVTPGEALRLCLRRSTLRRTVRIALVVGTVLSLINQAGVILGGRAGLVTWLRVAANYFVPFCVSTAGFLSASHSRPR